MKLTKKILVISISLYVSTAGFAMEAPKKNTPILTRSQLGLQENASASDYCHRLRQFADLLINQDHVWYITKKTVESDEKIYNNRNQRDELVRNHLETALPLINNPEEREKLQNALKTLHTSKSNVFSSNGHGISSTLWALYPITPCAWATLFKHYDLIKAALADAKMSDEHLLLAGQWIKSDDSTVKYIGNLITTSNEIFNLDKTNTILYGNLRLYFAAAPQKLAFCNNTLLNYLSCLQGCLNHFKTTNQWLSTKFKEKNLVVDCEFEKALTARVKNIVDRYQEQRPSLIALFEQIHKEMHQCIAKFSGIQKRNLMQYTYINGNQIPQTLDETTYPEHDLLRSCQTKTTTNTTTSQPEIAPQKNKKNTKKIAQQKAFTHKPSKKSNKTKTSCTRQSDGAIHETSKPVELREEIPVALVPETTAVISEPNTSATCCTKNCDSLDKTEQETPEEKSCVGKTTHKQSRKHKKPAVDSSPKQPTITAEKTTQPVRMEMPAPIATNNSTPVSVTTNDSLAWVDQIPYRPEQTSVNQAESFVIITDPSNEIIIYLFGHNIKNEMRWQEPIKYYPNGSVLEWFKNSRQALTNQGYCNPQHRHFAPTRDDLMNAIQIHRFSRLVDQFIPTMGYYYLTPSHLNSGKNDICIAIPGQVEYLKVKDSNNAPLRKLCAYVYIIDSETGYCYHRNITLCKTSETLNKLFAGNFWIDEFPPVGY